jgi:hypothetical protein
VSFAEQMIKALGIDPAELERSMRQVIADASTVKGEVLAAKQGFIAAVQLFDGRLTAIEQSNARIERALNIEPERTADHDAGTEPRRLNGPS